MKPGTFVWWVWEFACILMQLALGYALFTVALAALLVLLMLV